MQTMNTPDYVVRPKITVVKSKTRGTDSARTRIDRDESNQFQSRLGLKLQLQQFVLFVYILWLKCFLPSTTQRSGGGRIIRIIEQKR
jgi:outer membrane autotransporter protein